MNHLYSRPLNDLDEARLKALFQCIGQDLPEAVIHAYWKRKVFNDRIAGSAGLTVDAIIAVAEDSGVKIPLPGEPGPSKVLQEGQYEPGTIIEVKWRNRWTPCEYRSSNAKSMHVVMDGEDRNIDFEGREIRLPELQEA